MGRSQGVVLSFLYWVLRRLLELFVLRMRSEREKEIEILVLRHQLHVLDLWGCFYVCQVVSGGFSRSR